MQSKIVLLYDEGCGAFILFITWSMENAQMHPNWALPTVLKVSNSLNGGKYKEYLMRYFMELMIQ